MLDSKPVIGQQIKEWRQRRRLTQREVALAAGLSTRHLSFIETGRATPSRHMVLHLAEYFRVPVRDRNQMLVAAGYAPIFLERPLEHPDLAAVQEAITLILERHKPCPALALDRHEWRAHALHRLQQQVDLSADPVLAGLHRELLSYPAPAHERTREYDVFVPYRVHARVGLLSFLTTTMVFGTPLDITLSELMLESFFPADAATAEAVRALSSQ